MVPLCLKKARAPSPLKRDNGAIPARLIGWKAVHPHSSRAHFTDGSRKAAFSRRPPLSARLPVDYFPDHRENMEYNHIICVCAGYVKSKLRVLTGLRGELTLFDLSEKNGFFIGAGQADTAAVRL